MTFHLVCIRFLLIYSKHKRLANSDKYTWQTVLVGCSIIRQFDSVFGSEASFVYTLRATNGDST
ncbi:hypothetical protein L1286_16200 [Pseudoalteromonas sp. SMS1]|uniref:hypothetical protein n=1 Tax=Pseudoalteromonas sp. SMS1 TaxID=2908894 RepID=UPI001F4006DA|nr:hypothetical protein [Pseudoalteromonas sp. SMS1]MCF2859027.1 hypothetical protein [Pseudoalteromonas sp. SMS1]